MTDAAPASEPKPIRRGQRGVGADTSAEVSRLSERAPDDIDQLEGARVPVAAEVSRRMLAAMVRLEDKLDRLLGLGERLVALAERALNVGPPPPRK